MTIRSLAIACGALALLPAAARADNSLKLDASGNVTFYSEDAGVANAFLVNVRGSDVRFKEPNDKAGINYPIGTCTAGETNGSAVIEVFCPKASVKTVAIDSGPGEDVVTYQLSDIPFSLGAGTGADTVTTDAAADNLSGDQGNDSLKSGAGNDDLDGGEGNDTLDGGDGNDKISGGTGADTISGGAGDDTVNAADGIADKIDCGDGNDTVIADTLDELTACETVRRDTVAAPADQPDANDHTAPKLVASGFAVQRVTKKRRSVRVISTCSERGLIQATAFLDAGGLNDRLKPLSAKVPVGGGGVELKLAFSKRLMKLILGDFKHHRTPRVKVTVSCVDAAGNTSRPRRFWIGMRK